jgi:gluconate 2-dehydrogenase gamma chain
MKNNRRSFIQIGGALSGTLLLASCGKKVHGKYRSLTDAEATTVIALCEQIIPADEFPGATDAGVIFFIDRQLGERGFYPSELPYYQKGVSALNAASKKLHGARFEKLDSNTQHNLLEKVEAGKVDDRDWKPSDQKDFFRMILAHTMQGFYGSPRHGGNRNYMSYTMMGVEYPLVIGQNRYGGFEGFER